MQNNSPYQNSPFHLRNELEYARWKHNKLEGYPTKVEQLLVPIANPFALTPNEIYQLRQSLLKTNMVIYSITSGDMSAKSIPESIGRQLGIRNLDKNECADNDSFTSLQVMQQGLHQLYIPYSNKPLNWHTDGYYNKLDEQIYSMLLHCVRDAESGGENYLLDPDMLYMLIRDKNPELITALMEEDTMIIPKNVIDGELIRPDRVGPVFQITSEGRLHMRYTARARNVIWKDNATTQMARQLITEILQTESAFRFKARLQPGQGLVCNNILHTRSAFKDNPEHPRLLYRGRYLDKIQLEGLNAE